MYWTQRLRGAGTAVAAAALIGGVLAVPTAEAAGAPHGGRLTDLVNPFIGTENEGNTYPGAAVPFGMVQLSPDTGHNTGYDHAQNEIRGFSSVHISGVGCGLGGDLPTLPTTGDVTETDYAKYAAKFSHDNEKASPGYYKVGLDSGITAELTATKRTGVQRYTFPATDKANILLNAGQSLHKTVSTSVEVLDSRTIRTAITGSGFCQDTKPYTLYTVTHFDRPFTTSGTWKDGKVTEGSDKSTGTGGNGAWVRFDTSKDRTVEATTAISYVDATGAARNLRAEGGKSFDRVQRAAQASWEDRLDDVQAQGGSDTQRRTFYSSLYRSFLAPNIGSDADGRYTGWDQKIHRAKGFDYYQNWSLWDTYRTQTQLLSSSRRARRGTWRSPYSRSTSRAAGCPSGGTARSRRTS